MSIDRRQKGAYSPSETRRMNALTRLVDEHGVAYTAKLFARVLRERTKDPMASTVREHLLMGVVRAEAGAADLG